MKITNNSLIYSFIKWIVFVIPVICSGFTIERNSGCSIEKSNTVLSFEVFLQQRQGNKKSAISKFDPDWIVFIDGMSVKTKSKNDTNTNKTIGTWFGKPKNYTRDFDLRTIDWIKPHPEEQIIILLILSDKGLPKELKKGRAYLWKGGKEFINIRKFDRTLKN